MGRWTTRRLIEALDPETDYWRIYRLHAQQEFPWDFTRAAELALYRTYAVPSIGGLLDRTGELRTRTQKRYDDTSLLLGEVLENGLDSERGKRALRMINRAHARYPIDRDDARYVLATLLVVPARWIDRYGWRRVTEHERRAAYLYYRELGRRMGVKDWPGSFEEVCDFLDDYEARHFAYSAGGSRTATATRELFVSWFPRTVAPLSRAGIIALLDPPLLRAFGYAPAPAWLRVGADLALRARARVVRFLPPRSRPVQVRDGWTVRSYPAGYVIEQLGPG